MQLDPHSKREQESHLRARSPGSSMCCRTIIPGIVHDVVAKGCSLVFVMSFPVRLRATNFHETQHAMKAYAVDLKKPRVALRQMSPTSTRSTGAAAQTPIGRAGPETVRSVLSVSIRPSLAARRSRAASSL